MIVAVDLDGTLCSWIPGEYDKAQPFPEKCAAIRRLKDRGEQIWIYTARGSSLGSAEAADARWGQVTREQLTAWQVPFDQLIFGKPPYEVLIDDRSVVFTQDWEEQLARNAATREARTAANAPQAPAVCYLCGSEDCERISDCLRAGLETRFALRPYRCRKCSLVFLHPLMSPAEESAFYENEYRRIYHGGEYDLESFDRARQADSNLRVDRLRTSGLLRGQALDVGCSTGNFLATIRPEIAGVRGVEPDARQRAFAQQRGIPVESDVSLLGDGKFDLITVFHVLEHIRDPSAFLADLAGRLAPGGALVVEVPNVDDALLGRFHIDEFAQFYWHPAHSYYFSAATLKAVAERAKLQAEVTGVQRYTLANHLSWLRDRRPGGKTADTSFVSEATLRAYSDDLCRSFACDTLWMVCRPL